MSKLLINRVSKLLTGFSRQQVPICGKGINYSPLLFLSFEYHHQSCYCGCPNYCVSSKRFYSEKKDVSLQSRQPDSEIQTDVKYTIKEATKTASYTGVILVGVGVTAALFYAIFRELFSSKSPSGVYSSAFKKCCEDTRVQDALGTPIKGHGEETSRGRRRHVSHVNYEKDGIPHIRMVFYLKGARNNASVHLDMRENSSGDLEYRYLFVQLDDYTRRVIVLEDNRAAEDAAKSFRTPLDEFSALAPN